MRERDLEDRERVFYVSAARCWARPRLGKNERRTPPNKVCSYKVDDDDGNDEDGPGALFGSVGRSPSPEIIPLRVSRLTSRASQQSHASCLERK